MKCKCAVALMFLLLSAILSSFVQAQEKNPPGSKVIGEKGTRPIIGEKGSEEVIGEKGTVATIDDDGFISFIGEESLAKIFGEELLFEILGGEGIVTVIGEKGSDKVIGEKGSGEIIGEKGRDKVIGEKGSGKIIGEKGRVVRGVKTGRTVQLVGAGSADASMLNKLNVGNRLRVKTGGGATATTYTLVEPPMNNSCCAVVKLSTDGNVLATNRSTGESFLFNVPDTKIRESLRAGQPVGTDSAGRWAFIRTTAVRGLKGQQATYSFPIRRDGGKQPSTPTGGRRP